MSFKHMRQTAAKLEQPDIAIAEILAMQQMEDTPIAADPGSEKLIIYTIENFELSEIDPAMHGQFFSGDSYVIQYEYEIQKKKAMYLVLLAGCPKYYRRERCRSTTNKEFR